MHIGYKNFLKSLILVITFITAFHAHASIIDGTIDGSNYTAQVCETTSCTTTTTSPINFGYFTTASSYNVHVSDSSLTGYIWGKSFGWAVLNCINTTSGCSSINGNFKVANNNNGNLSGYAWGENSGWINFGPFSNSSTASVVIDSSGQFNGYAWSQNFGWIKFDCGTSGYCVKTDWRPMNTRPQCSDGIDNDNDGNIDSADSGCIVGNVYDPTDNVEIIQSPPPIIVIPPVILPPVITPEPVLPPPPPPVITPEPILPPPPVITPQPVLPPPPVITPIVEPTPDPTPIVEPIVQVIENIPQVVVTGITEGLGNVVEGLGNLGDAIFSFFGGGDSGNNSGGTSGGGSSSSGSFGGGFAITQVAVDQIANSVVEGAKATEVVVAKAAKKTSEAVNTPTGKTVTKTVSTVGVVSGASVSITTALFANPLSFSEIFLIPIRLWGLLMAALGIKKRNRPWGTVYDSVTKQPLDPAYVILQDLNGNEIATSITDIDGRYGFLVLPGKYRMIAHKTNYEFPSKQLSGKAGDEIYQDLYASEIIDILEGGVITKNIPMDPLNFDWNEFAKKQQGLNKFYSQRDLWLAHISNFLFVFGFSVTLIAVFASPKFYNIATLGIYIILYILKRTVLKPRPFGTIRSKETNSTLPFAIIRVFAVGSEREVIHKITDKSGKYYCLIPNGSYYIKVEKKNLDGSYSLVHTSSPIEVTNGYISSMLEV